ncbi:ATP-binding protein [Nocardioides sp. CFH 31398]|uniref:sensor histidine kinase n=1 Tax=Nocardioides sp. CFH 31398 TaxID=2919579 RepID=UPI001F052913|nr:ATP-binding protein [Nocardioides sp. CFH 31398]MCH1866014.1 ATP-binding protein [Nocardioides sp. CFH 31398]
MSDDSGRPAPRRSLSRRLAATFTALGAIGVLVVGVNGYTLTQWRASEEEQERHYLRSLRLMEARALTFEAFKEVPDATLGGDPDARQDYEERTAGIASVLDDWASLAEDAAEEREVEQVRAAAAVLDDRADRVFDLVEQGRRGDARGELERVEEEGFEPFDAVTDAAVASDEVKREEVREGASAARRTASIALVVAGLGVVSLLLLIGAFLAGGVFRPVRELHRGLSELAAGRTGVRLPEGSDDEIGLLSRDFNQLAQRVEDADDRPASMGTDGGDDARLVLSRVVDGLADEVTAAAPALEPERAATLTVRVAAARLAVDRLGSIGHPVDLDLVVVDPAALLHDVVGRVADELVRRAVALGIDAAGLSSPLVADRARLRETLSELVRNALDALPERGGSLRLSASDAEGGIALEVSDDGPGFRRADVAWLHDGTPRPDDTRGVGLRLATAVVEQHGGRLSLRTGPDGRGTTARVLLPTDPGRARPGPRPRRPREGRTTP